MKTTLLLGVRVTEAEHAQVQAQAKAAGLSMSSWFRLKAGLDPNTR